jgi:hypothetical protein
MLDRPSNVEVLLRLDAGPDSDDEELDRHTEQLRRRLLELDVENAYRPAVSDAPEGARAIDAATMGLIVVQLLPVLPALHDIVQIVRVWLSQHPDRTATLEIDGDRIEVSGISMEEQRELIRIWTDRHARG